MHQGKNLAEGVTLAGAEALFQQGVPGQPKIEDLVEERARDGPAEIATEAGGVLLVGVAEEFLHHVGIQVISFPHGRQYPAITGNAETRL